MSLRGPEASDACPFTPGTRDRPMLVLKVHHMRIWQEGERERRRADHVPDMTTPPRMGRCRGGDWKRRQARAGMSFSIDFFSPSLPRPSGSGAGGSLNGLSAESIDVL
jgi:hypothetical protein